MPEPKLNREDHLQGKDSASFLSDLSVHLEDLRSVIVYSVVFLIAVFALAFYYSEDLINLLKTLAPNGSSFFQLKPGELFVVSLKVSFFAALYAAIPFVISQIYFFIKPALSKKENDTCILVSFLAPVLFYMGLVFAFYFLLPSLLDFLLNFKEGVVEKRYGLESFINLVLSIETVTAISFQLPVVIFVLGILGLVQVGQLFMNLASLPGFSKVVHKFITPIMFWFSSVFFFHP